MLSQTPLLQKLYQTASEASKGHRPLPRLLAALQMEIRRAKSRWELTLRMNCIEAVSECQRSMGLTRGDHSETIGGVL